MTQHPHLYFSRSTHGPGRSIDSVRSGLRDPLVAEIWNQISARCREEWELPPFDITSMVSGRRESAARDRNPDAAICNAIGNRLMRQALALHLDGEERHLHDALSQLRAVFDESRFPEWIDQAHRRFNYPADLRCGQLCQTIGTAYDWLHPFLEPADRQWILEGLERRGFRPFLQSMAMDPWWSKEMHNWYSVIIGGVGVGAMGVGDDHPLSTEILEISIPLMKRFPQIYGREGEYNESVGYSNATRFPVSFFAALRCHQPDGEQDPLTAFPFPQTAAWTVYCTVPPGRLAAFGDGQADAPPDAATIAAIATATRDPILQWFARSHFIPGENPYDLLWFDPSLPAHSPEGYWPHGRAFYDHGAQFSSRASWHLHAPDLVVYGKAGRERNHDQNDIGQVCIDAAGERLILDPANPSSYPADFFGPERYQYYNASITGHNVLQIGNREQNAFPNDWELRERSDFKSISGRILRAEFTPGQGGLWKADLTRAYDSVKSVQRTVMHLTAGLVAVLDEADLEGEESIVLRWHAENPTEPDAAGRFFVRGKKTALASRIIELDGNPILCTRERHAYRHPYDRDRSGDLLEQRHEPFIQAVLTAKSARLLTLFALLPEPGSTRQWEDHHDGWHFEADSGPSGVARWRSGRLQLRDRQSGYCWEG